MQKNGPGLLGWHTRLKGIGLHGMSCACPVIKRYLKMLVSNATAGILIGKGGMALKDFVFCLAAFLVHAKLTSTIDLQSTNDTLPPCISPENGHPDCPLKL